MMSFERRRLLAALAGLCTPAALLAAEAKPQPAMRVPKLSAEQVIEKFYVARGGLQAWRGVASIAFNGKMDVGFSDSVARSKRYVGDAASSNAARRKLVEQAQAGQVNAEAEKQLQLPFLMEMKRPNKARVEVEFAGKTSIQVYDGDRGWLKRPYLNRDDWEPFSSDQAKMQEAEPGIDGLLLDHARRGIKVALDGVEPVEGHDAYKLALTLRGGGLRHVWIDAQSFLDVKIEGTPRRMDGRMHAVYVYQRDFRAVQGLMVPFVLETAVEGYGDTHKMTIQKVALNPQLEDSVFARPTS